MAGNEVTRESLYEEVWTEPMTLVAQRYVMSDSGLAKICRRLSIPIPMRGYWAKVRGGKSMRRIPLPPLEDLNKARFELQRLQPEPTARRIREATIDESATVAEGSVQIRTSVVSLHPLVEAAKRRLSKDEGWTEETGVRTAPNEVIAIAVTKKSVRRALLVCDAVLTALESHGVSIRLDPKQKCTWVSLGLVSMSFQVQETVTRQRHVPTAKEKQAISAWRLSTSLTAPYPQMPQHDYLPTGLLTISVGGWRGRSWHDTDKTKLEERLHKVVAGTLNVLAEFEAEAIEEERRRIIHQQMVDEFEARKKRVDDELAAFKRFEDDAGKWRRAENLRRYIHAVERGARERGELMPDTADWIAWANAKADWLDPRVAVSDVILDAPLPTDPESAD